MNTSALDKSTANIHDKSGFSISRIYEEGGEDKVKRYLARIARM